MRAEVVRYRRGRDDRDAKLRDLAGAALRGDTLAGELPWLVTGEAEASHRFGYALAVQDRGYTMLPRQTRSPRDGRRSRHRNY